MSDPNTDVEKDFILLLAAASTPLQPIGGDGIARCRLCYGELPLHEAGCLIDRLAASHEREQKLVLRDEDFDDLRVDQ